jgi:starch synthase
MQILHVSYECYPFVKVGGMADVVGALPKYLNEIGVHAAVVIPRYALDWEAFGVPELVFETSFQLDWEHIKYRVELYADVLEFPVYTVDIPGKFDRPEVYSYGDDTQRSIAFQRAILYWLLSEKDLKPDIIHCHDHHTGLIPFFVGYSPEYSSISNIPTFFTIHNGAYQGAFSWDLLKLLPGFYAHHSGLIDWAGAINPLAAAIRCAWHFNTVSEGYLTELQLNSNGLEWLINNELSKASGIVNGIDTAVWDPANDPLLPVTYKRSVDVFKRKNKADLCANVALDPEKATYLFIGRLAYEKGADMLPTIVGDFLAHFDDVQFVLLGTGQPKIENDLRYLEKFYPDRIRCFITYSEELSHRLYASADFLLMPSRIEPCGLNQMYCMRYGGIPIVRRTGGLMDTVEQLSEQGGNGYLFDNLNVNEVRSMLAASRNLYKRPELMSEVRQRNFSQDFSWQHSAKTYLKKYESLL